MKDHKWSKFPGIEKLSHGDVTCSIENIVNSIVTAWHGVRWLLDLACDHVFRSVNVEQLGSIPETDVML